jgi:hypothetical protein
MWIDFAQNNLTSLTFLRSHSRSFRPSLMPILGRQFNSCVARDKSEM